MPQFRRWPASLRPTANASVAGLLTRKLACHPPALGLRKLIAVIMYTILPKRAFLQSGMFEFKELICEKLVCILWEGSNRSGLP